MNVDKQMKQQDYQIYFETILLTMKEHPLVRISNKIKKYFPDCVPTKITFHLFHNLKNLKMSFKRI
jgi:hypothetical protein